MTRVHVILGDGGVGKTTLSAAYALALAAGGGRVGLLSIDPARRLESALGLAVHDGAVRVPVDGDLHAAHLMPEVTLRRWVLAELPESAHPRLARNRFFPLLADRLASTTDVIAALRMAEWLETDPSLTDLVVDTAPGRNGIELLVRPGALVQLTRGRATTWLRHLGGGRGPLGGVGGRIVGGLARLGGSDVLGELADLVDAVRPASRRALDRLRVADEVLRGTTARFLIVTAPRPDAARGARALCAALDRHGVVPTLVLVNRVLPRSLGAELAGIDDRELGAGVGVVRYVRAYCESQAFALAEVEGLEVPTRSVPAAKGLDGEGRLAALTSLGRHMVEM